MNEDPRKRWSEKVPPKANPSRPVKERKKAAQETPHPEPGSPAVTPFSEPNPWVTKNWDVRDRRNPNTLIRDPWAIDRNQQEDRQPSTWGTHSMWEQYKQQVPARSSAPRVRKRGLLGRFRRGKVEEYAEENFQDDAFDDRPNLFSLLSAQGRLGDFTTGDAVGEAESADGPVPLSRTQLSGGPSFLSGGTSSLVSDGEPGEPGDDDGGGGESGGGSGGSDISGELEGGSENNWDTDATAHGFRTREKRKRENAQEKQNKGVKRGLVLIAGVLVVILAFAGSIAGIIGAIAKKAAADCSAPIGVGSSSGSPAQQRDWVGARMQTGVGEPSTLEQWATWTLKFLWYGADYEARNSGGRAPLPEDRVVTQEKIIALVAWAWSEGGSFNQNYPARYNPLNTILSNPDLQSSNRRNANGSSGALKEQAYPTFDLGVEATARAIEIPHYSRIRQAFVFDEPTAEAFFSNYLGNPDGDWGQPQKNWAANDPAGVPARLNVVTNVRRNYERFAGQYVLGDGVGPVAGSANAISGVAISGAACTGVGGVGVGTSNYGTFVCPIAGPVRHSDDFLAPRDGGNRRHQGNDVMAPMGAPLIAVADGTIERVETVDKSTAGLSIYLRDTNGNLHYYFHNSRVDVVKNQTVKAGDVIGAVGNSGNARGGATHVHYEFHPGGGPAVDAYRAVTFKACASNRGDPPDAEPPVDPRYY